jgi:hypothetical protein
LGLGKPILDADVFPFNPAKLSQLLSEYIHQDRHAGGRAWIKEPYAEDFYRLLRMCHSPTERECETDGEHPHQF